MRAGSRTRAGLSGLIFLGLAGCQEGSSFGQQTFRGQYATARNALEAGQYARANQTYVRLIQRAGPLAPRIRLEYAHSQLRSGDYVAAANQAGTLAEQQEGAARAAALAVRGTAQHELGLAAFSEGDAKTARVYLKEAAAAFDEVLKDHPDLDPLGALAGRRASIKVRMGGL